LEEGDQLSGLERIDGLAAEVVDEPSDDSATDVAATDVPAVDVPPGDPLPDDPSDDPAAQS
jgi:hypothetical protein